jgi:hypothetical protein
MPIYIPDPQLEIYLRSVVRVALIFKSERLKFPAPIDGTRRDAFDVILFGEEGSRKVYQHYDARS